MEFKVTSIGNPPGGWRLATCAEFDAYKDRLNLSQWAIVALADGKGDGSGYGGRSHPGFMSRDGIGEMVIVRGSGGGGGGGGGYSSGRRSTFSNLTKINYMDDIPDGYRLLSCDEYEANFAACQRFMGQWDILLLTDGKCDGMGYGGKAHRQTRQERERSSSSNERMGEILIGREDGGSALQDFKSEVLSAYGSYLHSTPESDLVNKYLTYSSSRYEPAVLVSSCPGDAHGGAHSRVKAFTESRGWRFAPVYFVNQQDANDWKRLWKIQVEEFACRFMSEGQTTILEVKIDGGGAGCATERSRNMSQWWVDWVKRLGCDICSDLARRGSRSAFDLSGCVTIQIGQAVVSEEEFLDFPNSSGNTLTPIPVNGLGFEQHTLTLNANERFWVLITDAYTRTGNQSYVRDSSRHVVKCGTF